MSNQTGLDWLARNVHVWPTETDFVFVGTGIGHGNMGWYPADYCFSKSSLVTRQQWLARRAELQNKPNWDDAPAQATCMAQEPRGLWTFFACQPPSSSPVHDTWWRLDGFQAWSSHMRGEVLGDWRDTLEKRPEQDEFETFTSIEDNQDQVLTQQQDNGWFERGELPPVGMAVQLWHGGTYAYDCELIAKRGNNFVLWSLTWDRPDSADCMMCEFKPIPTERDVLIEIIKKTDDTDDKIAYAILAAGFSLRDK